jgi:uncharacterized RDD family membrane protein YckC
MSQLSITTTQNVTINFNTATGSERVLAAGIDLAIKAAYVTVAYYIILDGTGLLEKMYKTLDPWSVRAILMIIFLPVMLYSIVLETFMEGQTFGKKIMKLRVIKIDGYQAGFGDYLIRWVVRPFEVVSVMIIVGVVAIMTSKKTQRLGDMAAGTGVISLKNDITIDHTILREVAGNYTPVYPLVVRLSDNDVRIIKETFESSYKSADFTTMDRLREKVEAVTGIKSVNESSMAFLDTIIKDYNYYTQNM